MNKKRFLKAGTLRESAGRFVKGSATALIALMFVVVPTAAHAEGLSDYIPTGPDFATLGPLAPIVVGFLAVALAIVGIFGIIGGAVSGVRFGWGAMTNNERVTTSALSQLKFSGIAVGISLGGAIVMVLGLNLVIGIIGLF